jgi:hypothetical protein
MKIISLNDILSTFRTFVLTNAMEHLEYKETTGTTYKIIFYLFKQSDFDIVFEISM